MVFHCKQLRMRSSRTDHFWQEFQNAHECAGVCQRSGCSLIGSPVFWRQRELYFIPLKTLLFENSHSIRCSLLALDGMDTCCCRIGTVADWDRLRESQKKEICCSVPFCGAQKYWCPLGVWQKRVQQLIILTNRSFCCSSHCRCCGHHSYAELSH